MPVRLRITFVFAVLVFLILGMLCLGIYYVSYTSRINTVKTRLTNRAITTARLLTQQEIFDRELIRRIDSSTTISRKHIIVQAYDYKNQWVYNYVSQSGDQLEITSEVLDDARVKGRDFFEQDGKEVAVYHYTDADARLVMVAAGEDLEGQQTLSTLVRILAISLFAGLVIVILSGYFFSGILLRPVRNISNEVNEISAQNLARRIATGPSKDEWYQLASTLNQLLNRLQESFETQRRFIANASHELSTPLTAISSQLDVCLQNPRETDEYRRVIQSVSQDVHNMSLLTQTLLEFAKASGDPGGLEISRIRMDEVLLRLPAEVSKLNSAYQVKLVFDDLPEEEEALLVLGNETLLLSALKNIVGNACKYSSDNRAEVGFAVQEKNLVLTITDHGIGVPEEELSRIFQPFYRVRENISEGGFGLGLPLAQRIIKLHDGVIQVTSKVGEGTRFVVQIPASNR